MSKISIIGLGFIGLPLACIVADIKKRGVSKFEIVGIDKKCKSKLITKERFLENFKRNLTDEKLILILNKAKKNERFNLFGDYKNIKNVFKNEA